MASEVLIRHAAHAGRTQRHQRSLQKRSDDLAEANRALPHIESPSNPRYQAVVVARRFAYRPSLEHRSNTRAIAIQDAYAAFSVAEAISSAPASSKIFFAFVGFCAVLGVDRNQNIPLSQFPFVLV